MFPTFEENGIFLLYVPFLFSQFSAIERLLFKKKKFMLHWRYRLLEIKFKTIFCLQWFVAKLWKLPIWPCSGLIHARFVDFFHNLASAPWLFYARIIPHNKTGLKWIEASLSVVLISYDSSFYTVDRWYCPKITVFQNFPPKPIRYGLRGSQNFHGCVLIYEQSCLTKNYYPPGLKFPCNSEKNDLFFNFGIDYDSILQCYLNYV